jgi:Spy/CpxP family protein refolding chaperone
MMKRNGKIALIVLACGALVLAVAAAPLSQAQQQPQSKTSVEPESSRPARTAPEFRSRLGEGLGKWLGLSPEQQAKFDDLHKARFEEHQAMSEQMRKLDDEFRALREDPKADPRKADALIDRMEKLRADRMKSDFRFHQDLDRILTPEQRKKLDEIRSRFDRRGPRGYGLYGFGYPGWGFGLGFGRFYRPFAFGYLGAFPHRGFFGTRFHRFGGWSHSGRGFRRF